MEKNTFTTKKFVELALLVAIIIVLAFTPLGYIKTLGLEITLIVVPVTVGAITLGPAAGAVLGLVFGLTSFIQCFGMSAFGAALFQINPFTTCIVCIVPRFLMGWCTGLIYRGLCRIRQARKGAIVVASLMGPLLNTLFFMSALLLFFYQTPMIQDAVKSYGTTNVLAFALAFVGINGLVEAVVCFVAGGAVSKALQVALKSS
ncbi:MAG: ECF transporter S component [Eubacterium sp.]|mgnify:CR=1 FL=1|jgi:uncharacterized membrane protein|nr:ECF transporter S component [Eubacterium sp.]